MQLLIYLLYTSWYFKIQLPTSQNFLPVLAHWENEAEVIGQQKTMLSWPHNVSSESGHAPPPAAPNRPLRGGIVLIEFQWHIAGMPCPFRMLSPTPPAYFCGDDKSQDEPNTTAFGILKQTQQLVDRMCGGNKYINGIICVSRAQESRSYIVI